MIRLTVLGSGDAFGSEGRRHSAYLIEAEGQSILVDCGPTILQALKQMRFDTGSIDLVLLTHLHGDHFGGVPFLFMEYRYENPRTRPLAIHGPPDTQRRVEAVFRALYEKTASEPSPHPVHYVEVAPGGPHVAGPARVTALPVPHVAELVCFAYRLEIAGRTIVYSGDTAWTDDLVELARGADVFLCECSTFETRVPIHVSYPEVAARAGDLGCRRLVLTHLGSEPLARRGEITIECAEDGMVIEL